MDYWVMSEEDVVERLRRIEDALNKSKPLYEITLRIIEIVVIPVLGIVLSIVLHSSSIRISDSQNRLAEAQLELNKEKELKRSQEVNLATDLQMFELFFEDIKDPSNNEQAISLLAIMSPTTETKIRKWINAGKGTPEGKQLKADLKEIDKQLVSKVNTYISKVSTYKVQILYNKNKPNQKLEAEKIKSALVNEGVTSSIEVSSHGDTASSNQIRYYAANELEVARALQRILTEAYPQRSFDLQTVYTKTPGSVSIFLRS